MKKIINKIAHALIIALLLCISFLGFSSSALNNVRAEGAEPSIEVNFTKGIAYNGLINNGVVYDADTKSASFDGNSFMYFEPDVSDNFNGSFTVIVGAYLKAQETSGYIFNTGYYANSVALELNYANLNFYFGNAENLRFSLRNILTETETFYLISLGYDANEKVLFYKVQTDINPEDIKGGSVNVSDDIAFPHVEYCLTLGAQSKYGADVINYSTCKLNTFQIHNAYLNDSNYLNSLFNIYGGVEDALEPSEPTIPDETPSTPQEPAEEPFFFSTWEVVGIICCAIALAILFVILVDKLKEAYTVGGKVVLSILVGFLVLGFFAGSYYILGVLL